MESIENKFVSLLPLPTFIKEKVDESRLKISFRQKDDLDEGGEDLIEKPVAYGDN